MKRIIFVAVVTAISLMFAIPASAQYGYGNHCYPPGPGASTTDKVITGFGCAGDVYLGKKSIDVQDRDSQRRADNDRRRSDQQHDENKSREADQSNAEDKRESNRNEEAMAQINGNNYGQCLNARESNCREILTSYHITRDADDNTPATLIIDNTSTGFKACLLAPGVTGDPTNAGGQHVLDNCQGIQVLPRQLTTQNWQSAGQLRTNLKLTELRLAGTDTGGCANEVYVHLVKKHDWKDQNGHAYPLAYYGEITQGEIRDCEPNRSITVDSTGNVSVVHRKIHK